MRNLFSAAAIAAALVVTPAAHGAGLCPNWAAPEKIGAVDSNILKEASGIAISRTYPDRLYHNQDSGDGPNFYLTDMKGGGTQTISVKGFKPLDVEDIALGPCAVGTCLFLADVGDNAEKRATVQIVIVPEKTRYKKSEKPLRIVTAKYPEWPREVTATGPALTDVLKAAGAEGKKILVQAADGYAPEFTGDDIKRDKMILAIEMDGKPLAMGGRGPAWLFGPPDSFANQQADEGFVFEVIRIDVQ